MRCAALSSIWVRFDRSKITSSCSLMSSPIMRTSFLDDAAVKAPRNSSSPARALKGSPSVSVPKKTLSSRQFAEQRGSREEEGEEDTGPDAGQRAGKVLFDLPRPEQHHHEGNADDCGVVHAERDYLGGLRPQDTRSYAGHHDMRQVGGEASDPEEPQQDLRDAGQDGDEGEFAQIDAVVGEDRGNNDGYGDARTADQHPRTTEHGGHETDDDEAVKARDRAHAGHDTQGHGDRQGSSETDHAGL